MDNETEAWAHIGFLGVLNNCYRTGAIMGICRACLLEEKVDTDSFLRV